MVNPLVSVVVATYNHSLYIKKALDSIFVQKVDFVVEVLIGDDCSSDDTGDIINSLIRERKKYFEVRYFRYHENIGMSKNGYYLISKAKGKYICFCDGDDFWLNPFRLKIQLCFLEKNPHIDLVAGKHYNCYGTDEQFYASKDRYISYSSGPEFFIRRSFVLLTVMFRNINSWPEWLKETYPQDRFFILLGSNNKPIHVIDDHFGCYRLNYQSITRKKLNSLQVNKHNLGLYFGLLNVRFFFKTRSEIKYYNSLLKYNSLLIALPKNNYLVKFYLIIINLHFLILNFHILNLKKIIYSFFSKKTLNI